MIVGIQEDVELRSQLGGSRSGSVRRSRSQLSGSRARPNRSSKGSSVWPSIGRPPPAKSVWPTIEHLFHSQHLVDRSDAQRSRVEGNLNTQQLHDHLFSS